MTSIKFKCSAKDEASLKERPLEPNHGVCPTASGMILEKSGSIEMLIKVGRSELR